ncbi:type II toxin-antitoxin system RelE/ParE family toxin [Lactobacillus crispatus]|uniref:type II toxin-antitoxin system RelE/ParE family toxin n=1 Tax=Lactobacillus crispatus TaxID=47770 RepID=UPI000C7A4AB9|nr:type II toxin-antitoxin system RelE/ParE family toxin [Lactobacillus crispatus]MCT7687246.1 type II toxin-antitoxin system RelE/ParE family toxin [Lactobacillus crispatus]MCT7730799.1 type II toxin-antitoxin system RelE/ParE family toxin [Lactobacillus crispatus]MCT7748021.1 type II toxin-antitoxin system RelE/ParE family toxin [Lactobacillus crispatus]MCT7788462.1 type II toxin-antitoxin system RelE/ParE family toxin [Lactobacillus crispatus]MCT7818850.1 type II toxin-antitoxin system RelE
MQEYTVKSTPNVSVELKEIYSSILQLSRSPKTARDYVKDLEQTMQALNYFPERYRKTPSGKYRRVNFKKYAIFYFIENDTVHIIDVILASSSTVFKY